MSLYRELFVELPQQLFEAAVKQRDPDRSGAGVADLSSMKHMYREAYRPPHPIIGLSETTWQHIADAFGWRHASAARRADLANIDIRAHLDCRHLMQWSIDERVVFMRRSPDLWSYLRDRFGAEPRNCYCVPR